MQVLRGVIIDNKALLDAANSENRRFAKPCSTGTLALTAILRRIYLNLDGPVPSSVTPPIDVCQAPIRETSVI
jgi:hypothetical protein